MKYRKSLLSNFFDVMNIIILVFACIVTIYPLVYVFSMSISDPDAVLAQEVFILQKGISFESYKIVFKNKDIWRAYGNTIWYTVVGTVINVCLTIMGAYALSRKHFFIGKEVMLFIAITMFFSGGLIPTFILINQLGIYNTRWALVLPEAVNAWNLIIARTYFQTAIPDSLPESAKIDGCSDIGILFKVVLPISMPIFSVLVIFYAVGHWNSWFNAQLYLSNSQLHPLQLFLRKILIMNSPDFMQGMENAFERMAYGLMLKYTSIIVATVPILLVYPFMQKHFVKGVMLGAIKG
ncbi:MAG TPA: carbohydrate ABC transporter permease [Clostridiaceae bacterium]|nr:carbohydrate ABC transporter permease [Clostridiaceae bacterium]